ncbi:MAG: hypothetical protein WAM30_07605 [Candidatus Dormiibacterota bacterium]
MGDVGRQLDALEGAAPVLDVTPPIFLAARTFVTARGASATLCTVVPRALGRVAARS